MKITDRVPPFFRATTLFYQPSLFISKSEPPPSFGETFENSNPPPPPLYEGGEFQL